MRYLISVLLILITFTACNKKEVIQYPNKAKTQKEKNIKIVDEKDTNTSKNLIELDTNNTIADENNNTNIDTNESMEINQSLDGNMSINFVDSNNSKIAIIYSSKKIGRYSIKVSDVVLAYSASLEDDFDYKFYDIENEDNESIVKVFEQLKKEEIVNIMFYITPKNLDKLFTYESIDEFNIYLPLNNASEEYISKHKNIIFGAIDYKAQLNTLIGIAKSKIVEIYDEKKKNIRLHSYLENNENIISYQIKGKYPNYKRFIQSHKKIRNSSIILNLDIVKSSIFMSQITANDWTRVSQILTTQSNYSPITFVLTQQKDRKKLIIVSSIDTTNERLNSITKLLGSDIRYDWVNYSTILGLELFNTKKTLLFDNINIQNNQVEYPNILYKTKKSSFVPFVNK